MPLRIRVVSPMHC